MEVNASRRELYDYVIFEFHFTVAALNMRYESPDRPILVTVLKIIRLIFVENILYSKKGH